MADTLFRESSLGYTEPRRIRTLEHDTPRAGNMASFWRDQWLASIRRSITKIGELPRGWDGYDAPKISYSTAIYASQIIQDLWRPGVPAPDISPMSSGGIMAEWIMGDNELTLEIEGPYATFFYFKDGDSDVEPDEVPVSRDLRKVPEHLLKMASQDGLVAA
jgi:hypothetical protein